VGIHKTRSTRFRSEGRAGRALTSSRDFNRDWEREKRGKEQSKGQRKVTEKKRESRVTNSRDWGKGEKKKGGKRHGGKKEFGVNGGERAEKKGSDRRRTLGKGGISENRGIVWDLRIFTQGTELPIRNKYAWARGLISEKAKKWDRVLQQCGGGHDTGFRWGFPKTQRGRKRGGRPARKKKETPLVGKRELKSSAELRLGKQKRGPGKEKEKKR